MIIACPSCSAKYQLADSKIKASGTKVRCPRCSHTFSVHKEQDPDDYSSEQTELFVRRDEIARPKPPPPQEDENVFDQKTSVSTSTPDVWAKSKAQEAPKPKLKPKAPKQDPALVVTPKEEDEASLDEETHSRHGEEAIESSEPTGEIRPFGEATLFEIQRGSKKALPKKWMKYAGIAAGALVLIFGVQKLFQSDLSVPSFSSPESTADLPYEIARPSGWYRDDPQVYQESLSQMAALPPSEQERPENRALLAESLILSGLLTGATDQVISGMSFSSSLVVSYPLTALGYYGIAAYALWNEDRRTLQDLVERWPEAYRDEPEFALVDAVYSYLQRDHESSLAKIKSLVAREPDFQRANDYALLFALRAPNIAGSHFSEAELDSLKANFNRHKALLSRDLKELPKLHREIDRLLEGSEASAKTPAPSATRPKRVEPPAASPAPKLKPPPPQPEEAAAPVVKPPPPRQQSSRLPAPSANLLAQNRVDERQRGDAAKFFETGNKLFKEGKNDEALKAYRDALKLNPEFADIYKRIGMIYMSRQESDRALRSFKIYLQLKPDSADKKLVEGWISSLQ